MDKKIIQCGGYCRDSDGVVHKVLWPSEDGIYLVLVCGTDDAPKMLQAILVDRLAFDYKPLESEKCHPDGWEQL